MTTTNTNPSTTNNDSVGNTLVTFHIGRGGRFYNQGHLTYVDQDKEINDYTGDLFDGFENQREILNQINNRPNLLNLYESAIEGSIDAYNRLKSLGLDLGKREWFDGSGNPVGLDVENDGTGRINIDEDYDTTYVCRLCECSDEEMEIIVNSNNWASSDVIEYCNAQLEEKFNI